MFASSRKVSVGIWFLFLTIIISMLIYLNWDIVKQFTVLGKISQMNEGLDGSSSIRIEYWLAMVEFFKEHPFLLVVGTGMSENITYELTQFLLEQ